MKKHILAFLATPFLMVGVANAEKTSEMSFRITAPKTPQKCGLHLKKSNFEINEKIDFEIHRPTRTEYPFIEITRWDNFIDAINFNNAYLENIGYEFPRPVISPHENPSALQYSDYFFVKKREEVALASDTRPASLTVNITCYTERTQEYAKLYRVFQNADIWNTMQRRNLNMGWDFEHNRSIDYSALKNE